MCSITGSYLNSNTCFSNQWPTHLCTIQMFDNGHGYRSSATKKATHNLPKLCVQPQGLIWTVTHAFLNTDQLIHAMGMFTHSGQLIDKQSVAHFLLTNTPTKCFTFPSYKYTNKVLHISFLQTHQQSVSHFLLTETHPTT
jgi:hypothetical protein